MAYVRTGALARTSTALVVAAGALCLLTIAPGSARAASNAEKLCRSGYQTIVANKSVRVFQRRARDGNIVVYTRYACYLRKPFTVRKLGRWDRFECGVYGFELAGRYVAYDNFRCAGGLFPCGVVIRDMKSGAVRRSKLCAQPPGLMTDLVLRSNGSVAWIRQLGGGQEYELWKLDSGGEVRVDSGSAIDPDSLALSGGRIYWMRAGEPQSAALD